jgi:hypothetical protein
VVIEYHWIQFLDFREAKPVKVAKNTDLCRLARKSSDTVPSKVQYRHSALSAAFSLLLPIKALKVLPVGSLIPWVLPGDSYGLGPMKIERSTHRDSVGGDRRAGKDHTYRVISPLTSRPV